MRDMKSIMILFMAMMRYNGIWTLMGYNGILLVLLSAMLISAIFILVYLWWLNIAMVYDLYVI